MGYDRRKYFFPSRDINGDSATTQLALPVSIVRAIDRIVISPHSPWKLRGDVLRFLVFSSLPEIADFSVKHSDLLEVSNHLQILAQETHEMEQFDKDIQETKNIINKLRNMGRKSAARRTMLIAFKRVKLIKDAGLREQTTRQLQESWRDWLDEPGAYWDFSLHGGEE